MKQRTLAKSVTATGVGLHSGERVSLTLHPAAENTGIQFRRSDLSGEQGEIVPLTPYLINDTRLSSTIVTENGIRVGTIEHIMSAFAAYGVDNILVELNAPEIPIMDGSSLPFIFLLQDAGVVEQQAEKRFLRILKEVSLEEPNKAALKCGSRLSLTPPCLTAHRPRLRLILQENLMWKRLRGRGRLALCKKWS